MSAVFLQVFNTSITAGWMVLAVVLLRLLLKKAPRWIRGILWGLVGLRLLLPFSVESVFSLIPSRETLPPDIVTADTPAIQSGIPIFNATVNPVMGETLAPQVETGVSPLQIILAIAGWVWLAGVLGMAIYALITTLRLKRRVAESIPLGDNRYLCDRIATPFILGVIKPRIYLPASMGEAEIGYVLAHEQAHLKRGDHLWKPLGFLLLTLHWFHPLLWVGYILLCRDIELATDEKVMKELGEEIKQPYAEALLSCSLPRRAIAACPLAFGEVGVKQRIKSVLQYKKPAFWVIVVAIAATAVAAVCLLTDPKPTDVAALDDQLQVFLDMQVAEQYRNEDTTDHFIATSYRLLDVEKTKDQTTLYMWVMYCEYTNEEYTPNNKLMRTSPTAITVRKTGDQYELVEYWTPPRDDEMWAKEIKEKFPFNTWSKALHGKRFTQEMEEECRQMANEYFGITQSTVGGVDGPQATVIMEESYRYQSERDVCQLELSTDDKRFSLTLSLYSSYLPYGRYEETDTALLLYTDDGKNHYTFRKVDGTLVFDAAASSAVPRFTYKPGEDSQICLPDGTVLSRQDISVAEAPMDIAAAVENGEVMCYLFPNEEAEKAWRDGQ